MNDLDGVHVLPLVARVAALGLLVIVLAAVVGGADDTAAIGALGRRHVLRPLKNLAESAQ